jgi:hypothetical protein
MSQTRWYKPGKSILANDSREATAALTKDGWTTDQPKDWSEPEVEAEVTIDTLRSENAALTEMVEELSKANDGLIATNQGLKEQAAQKKR